MSGVTDTAKRHKMVVFVGGTSFSGSTMLDMVLANDTEGFSCGEVHAVFRPYRRHHFQLTCGCGERDCRLWYDIKESGEGNVYNSIFELNPEIRFIVDSSKNPFWIEKQSKNLAKLGIVCKHILIWKSPAEILVSFRKRRRESEWVRSWVNYHKLYLRLVPDFRSIPYASMVREKEPLIATCRYLGIDYFVGKQEYWLKRSHTIFGNTSAKIHTREPNSGDFVSDLREIERNTQVDSSVLKKGFRRIYYDKPRQYRDMMHICSSRDQAMIDCLMSQLAARDISLSDRDITARLILPSAKGFPGTVVTRRLKSKWRGSLVRLLQCRTFQSLAAPLRWLTHVS